ncbi:DUF2155 domain-containing protein [Cereibacter azotoformans]|uniref:Uncharacterized protein DUF2155 n=2 Tax=Cereibacter TaxID=1653176 RepID=A0A2T5KCX1_9RHOB|nr:DUF2155 domain-containing protein [Cereibacter azotoformans]AXQ93483.1 DUF2155 domain-containing protein [Cereibacter sphaeroides]MBO4168754.1 DUF2155 domain-containing protein [Cereibacter azotoformans]PTR20254.1 uncharacterized protein DUF2155 [Cereibacter azotoformans]UIJ31819.1 DUF2155 domain-containing protein [Cereibacter azotoformans]ULB09646.1 DUF2155 domain-containing protein [Cereibacter azotoformans]
MRVLAALLLMAAPALAQDLRTAEGSGALLRWLDKMSGETADAELMRGQSAVSGHLTIELDECRYPAGDPASDAFAHLTIRDSRAAEPVFDGWMIASSPALSSLDHPRYDVWLLRCTTEAGSGE